LQEDSLVAVAESEYCESLEVAAGEHSPRGDGYSLAQEVRMEEILNRFRSLLGSRACRTRQGFKNGTHDPLVFNSFVDVISYLVASEEPQEKNRKKRKDIAERL
jgi:hypothetical protein